jgi:branched-chain amino acid transport system ATP-binding protein
MMNGSVLEVEGVCQRFGGVQALDDVSFEIAAGERLAIIGPNGAGKTTLFNCLTGMPPPSTGRVLFGGEDVTTMAAHARAGRGLARSFQTVNPFGNLTVEETALIAVSGRRRSRYGFSRRMRGFASKLEEAGALIERAGLAEQAGAKLGTLSYGEQRRLDLALTLAGEPRLFLFDEPSAGLSQAESDAIVTMVQALPASVAVAVIDHDMDVVFAVAERILVLDHGRLIAAGTGEEIRADSRVREVYLGEA